MSSSTRYRIEHDGNPIHVDVGPGRPAGDARPWRTDHDVRHLGTLHRDEDSTGRAREWAATSTAGAHSGPQSTRTAALTWLLDEDSRRAEAARAAAREAARARREAQTTEAAAAWTAHDEWQQANEDLRRAAETGTADDVAAAEAEEERRFRAYRAARTAEAAARTAARRG